ncbi:MAG: Holliday junction resolvase RuvX [Acidimicrobiia bacterium]
MRYLCLDVGERRVGVSAGDPSGRVAVPVAVVRREPGVVLAEQIRPLVDEYGAGALVVGLPVRTDGTEGPEAAAVRDEASGLAAALGIALHFWDERFTTRIAAEAAGRMGAGSRRRRGKIDDMAATVILQSFLDRANAESAE